MLDPTILTSSMMSKVKCKLTSQLLMVKRLKPTILTMAKWVMQSVRSCH